MPTTPTQLLPYPALTDAPNGPGAVQALADRLEVLLNAYGNPAFSTWVPTLTQTGAVTKTTNLAEYQTLGKFCRGTFSLAVTGPGTAGSSLLVGVPAVPNLVTAAFDFVVGSALVYDLSGLNAYVCDLVILNGAFAIRADGSAGTYWGVSPNLALANGDLVEGSFGYRVP